MLIMGIDPGLRHTGWGIVDFTNNQFRHIANGTLNISEKGTLPPEYLPHQLKGEHKGQWECHIKPNWLMTWEQNDKKLTLLFLETGTHADIFGW